MTATSAADPVMEAITNAVTKGRSGHVDSGKKQLLALWSSIGASGDPLHRCTLAHYLADLYDDPGQALVWDVRALEAADALTDQRVQNYHAGLHIAGFYPSLRLNLADNHRRLGSFDAARRQIDAARDDSRVLSQDSYGRLVRSAIEGVARAIDDRDTTPRPSAPAPNS